MPRRNLRSLVAGVAPGRAGRAVPTRSREVARWVAQPRQSAIHRYEMSRLYTSYGNPQMGDLFNDIVGAVVPGWDKRPDWMKKIQIKPDPLKLAQTAAKVVPPKEVGRVVDQASKYGINLNYQTPAGSVPITGQMVSSGYQNFPMMASFANKLSDIPTWVYAVGGVGLVVVVMLAAKK